MEVAGPLYVDCLHFQLLLIPNWPTGLYLARQAERSQSRLSKANQCTYILLMLRTTRAWKLRVRLRCFTDFPRNPMARLECTLHPSWPCRSVLTRKMYPALWPGNVRMQGRFLARLIKRSRAACPGILIPAVRCSAFKILA